MSAPAWLTIAAKYLGTHETPGPKSNSVIVAWAMYLTGWWRAYFTDDSAVPWCALFVNACLGEAGFKGTGTLRAADFATWGIQLQDRALGCVLVFRRPEGSHVGFYLGESPDALLVRGGNQGDAVSDTWIQKSRLIDQRWPFGCDVPPGGRVYYDAHGAPLSKDEK